MAREMSRTQKLALQSFFSYDCHIHHYLTFAHLNTYICLYFLNIHCYSLDTIEVRLTVSSETHSNISSQILLSASI